MRKVLDRWYDIDKLCLSRKEEETGLVSIEIWANGSIQRLEKCTTKNKERLITVASKSNGNIRQNSKKQNLQNENEKKNNYMDISSDK